MFLNLEDDQEIRYRALSMTCGMLLIPVILWHLGVPISTQWGPQGYHYPIQIAQYGLSHYSKYLIDKSRKMMIIDDAEDGGTNQWSVGDRLATVRNVIDSETMSRVIEFNADGK